MRALLFILSFFVTFLALAAPSVDFIHAYKDMDNFDFETLPKDFKSVAKIVFEKGIQDTDYDQAYQETQEFCLIEGHSKCEIVLDLFDQVNEELLSMEGKERVTDLESINTLSDTADKLAAFLGANFDDPNALLYEEDPHKELHEESEATPDRNSILLKQGEWAIQLALEESCEISVCPSEDGKMIPPSLEKINVTIIKQHEEDLVKEETSLVDKKRIYCILDKYYNENGMMDKLFEFLYLHMPEGENFCGN